MLAAGASGEGSGGAPREEPRAAPGTQRAWSLPGGGGDTCVTDLTGGAKTALVIYRGGIRMPQGESSQRSWRGRPMTGQGPLGKLQGFYMLRTFCEPSPTGPSSVWAEG